MPHRQQLIQLLNRYQPASKSEANSQQSIIDFVTNDGDCFDRHNSYGHITGSSWLVNPENNKALLTLHKGLNLWLQPGGHAENETDILQVSLREAKEESGIRNILPISQEIFDIDIHLFPAKGTMPGHFHFDIRFLLQAQDETIVVSDESHDVRWFDYNELINGDLSLDDSVRRLAKKWAMQNQRSK